MPGNVTASKLCFAPLKGNAPGMVDRCGLDWGHSGPHGDGIDARNTRDLTAENERLRREIHRAGNDKLRSGDFLQAEVSHWRKRYEDLRAAVDNLTIAHNKARYQLAPEPPVGTKFVQPQGGTWTRQDDGWHCPGESCNNCPASWDEVETYVRDATRHLPGVMASHD